jgi:hypothetical protein
MKNYKLILILSLAVFFCIGAQSDCDKKKILKNTNTKTENKSMNNDEMPLETPLDQPNSEIKKLAEGINAKIDTPFVFIVRTKETYAQMQSMVENLPAVAEIDFSRSAVVAAFAGEKNTGGYSVAIDGTRGNVSVKVKSPPPDAMVTQALTKPYFVALVPVGEEESLKIDLSENWMNAAESYKVTSGEFEYSGGFRGMQKKFEPKGTIKVLHSGENVTMLFDLEGKENVGQFKTTDLASGKLNDGKVVLPRLEAATLIAQPHPPFIVSGNISNEKMSLSFEKGKRSFVVNDGYEGTGKLEAVKEN